MAGREAKEGAYSVTEELQLELERLKKGSAPKKPLGISPADQTEDSDGIE